LLERGWVSFRYVRGWPEIIFGFYGEECLTAFFKGTGNRTIDEMVTITLGELNPPDDSELPPDDESQSWILNSSTKRSLSSRPL
jgi:hypothetical protein